MNSIAKIAGYNLGAIVAYSLLIRLVCTGFVPGSRGHSDAGLGIALLSAYAVGLHVIVCLIACISRFINNRNELGRAWLLTAGIVLVVGFSACMGNAALG